MSQINHQIQQIIDKRKLTRLPQIEGNNLLERGKSQGRKS